MTDAHVLAAGINTAFRRLWEAAARQAPSFDEFTLTAQQQVVLDRILADPQITPKALAEALQVSKGAVSQHLTALEALGYLSRHRSPTDGRVHVFRLEPLGQRYRDVSAEYEQATVDAYLAALSVSDMTEISAALDKLARVFEP